MSETVAVVDYGSGNLRSVAKALERAAGTRGKDCRVVVTGDAARIRVADRIVLPGVGAFGDCRQGLEAIPGMIEALEDAALYRNRPFLGICVGMQLMAETGLEHGVHKGFSWFRGEVRRLTPLDPALKVPHMGWNALRLTGRGRRHPLFRNIDRGAHMYFVHSYHVALSETEPLLATVDHGGEVTAAMARGNVAAVQFHPEKSQSSGLVLLENFLEWQP